MEREDAIPSGSAIVPSTGATLFSGGALFMSSLAFSACPLCCICPSATPFILCKRQCRTGIKKLCTGVRQMWARTLAFIFPSSVASGRCPGFLKRQFYYLSNGNNHTISQDWGELRLNCREGLSLSTYSLCLFRCSIHRGHCYRRTPLSA